MPLKPPVDGSKLFFFFLQVSDILGVSLHIVKTTVAILSRRC